MSSLTAPPDELLVRMPLGGRRLMLRWWTDDKRGHIVLARCRRAIEETAARIFAEDFDAKITHYEMIDLVAPSPRMQAAARESNRHDRIFKFHREIASAIETVMKAGHAIPGPFARCTEYAPDESVDINEWARARHYGCDNCVDTLRLINGVTPESLYETYYDAWCAAQPAGPHWCSRDLKGLYMSRAPVAQDGEPLRYAYADFGHHASGIELQTVSASDDAHAIHSDVLFFYRHLGQLKTGALTAMSKKAMADAARESDRRAKERTEERDRTDQQRIAATIAFFAP